MLNLLLVKIYDYRLNALFGLRDEFEREKNDESLNLRGKNIRNEIV